MASFRAAAILVCVAIVFCVTIPVHMVLVRLAPSQAHRFAVPVFRLITWLIGAKLTQHGRPSPDGACLIAANHISWIDIILISAAMPCAFIARSDMADWPLFGVLAKLKQSLFVERTRRSSVREFRVAMKKRLAEGDNLVLFAEGTSSDGNRVLDFKSALFSAVEHEECCVQPLTIAYTGQGGLPLGRRRRHKYAWYGDMELAPHIWRVLKRGPFEAELRFHDAVFANTLGNRKDLAEWCETQVRGGLIESHYRQGIGKR